MSGVWKYFNKIDNDKNVVCNVKKCGKKYKFTQRQGTTILINHLKKYHDIAIKSMIIKVPIKKSLLSAEAQKDIDDKLLIWIIKDNQSFRVTENGNFIIFVSALNENYKLLNRKQVASNIVKLYEESFITIRNLISENDSKYSISIDIWASNNKKSYLGVKIHYITKNFELKSFTLDFNYFDLSHTGKNMHSRIMEILNKFAVTRIQSLTSDNASNNIKCAELLKEHNFKNMSFLGCFAHIINLIIKSGPLKENSIIIKITDTVNNIKNSSKITESLRTLATIHELKYHTLVSDVATRWNSTYLMINSFVQNEKILKLYKETDVLSTSEWINIKKICELLKQFYDLTQIISTSSCPTIGLCYTIGLKIYEIIENFEKKNGFKKIAQSMKEKCQKYFEFMDDKYFVSMILDPRIKDRSLKDENKPRIIKYFNKIYQLYHSKFNPAIDKKTNNKTLFSSLLANVENNINNEVELYLITPTTDEKSDILAYWNSNKEQYPILSKMARDYLSIPSTSVRCEEMFSDAGELDSTKRNNLSSRIITAIMCLQSWL